MSKRSYRRLAVVAGAALAVGSMAPAMAARVSSGGTASASVDSVDISSVVDSIPPVSVSTGGVTLLAGSLLGTATSAPVLLFNDASNIVGDAMGMANGALGSSLSAAANGGVTAGPGGATVNLAGVAGAPLNGLGSLGSSGLVDDTLGTVNDVTGIAVPTALGAADLATSTAFGAVGTAMSLPGTANGVLSALMGSSASANVNLLAGVAGIF